MAKISPRSTRRSMPRTASKLPYDLRRPRISIAISPPATPSTAVTEGRRGLLGDQDGPHRRHEAEDHERHQRQGQERDPQVLLDDLVLRIAVIGVQVVDGVANDLRALNHGFGPCAC